MDNTIFAVISISAIFVIIFGVVLVITGNKMTKKYEGKSYLGVSIFGWILIALSVIGYVLYFILYINENGGFTGTLIFTFVAPLFIMIGFVLCVGIGASSLLEGYRKNKEGQRDKVSIVRGWFLLSLSIIVVAVVVITLVILFNNHANTMGDTPVRMM